MFKLCPTSLKPHKSHKTRASSFIDQLKLKHATPSFCIANCIITNVHQFTVTLTKKKEVCLNSLS